MAGIISAVVGGIVVSQINGSFVTVNGPAAGLIVVILASVDRLGGGEIGYQATLAATVISGLLLFVMGVFKVGELGDCFPSTVVHGMLAAIGIIITAKQLPFVLGVNVSAKEPLELIAHIPDMLRNINPEIACIGLVSLGILIAHGMIANKIIRRIPAPVIVVVVAILMGNYLDLAHAHNDIIGGHPVFISPKFLVSVPADVFQAITFPNFSQVFTYGFFLSVISITLVQAIESLLSASAVDKLDPYHRHSNLSRDMSAVGLGSALSGLIGGLPLIAEIVRSTANISSGAKTRWSNFFHGVFMLAAVIFCVSYINQIPLAALAALLVFTGCRLASPKVFIEAHEIGKEQLFIFVVTIVATLTTDLLIGVGIGIAAKVIIHLWHGVSPNSLFTAKVISSEKSGTIVVSVLGCALFSNFVSLKHQLLQIEPGKQVLLDLSKTRLIDHTVMERLYEFCEEYSASSRGGGCQIIGLDLHRAASSHPFAARKLVIP